MAVFLAKLYADEAEEETAEDAVKKLINKANARGGNDNISVAYLKKESGDM